MSATNAPNLKDHSPEALRHRLAAEGLPGYRADQIAGWLYGRGVDDLREMTDLGRALREYDITDEDPPSFSVYEKKLLLRTLDITSGDKLQAAKLLNVGKSTLYRKLKRHEIS